MCGIAGIISKEAQFLGEDILRMSDAIKHRGPDDWGYLSIKSASSNLPKREKTAPTEKGNIFFGHRRLSIIDIDGSQQPLSNEDSSVWITFNGEIYNYCELRIQLLDMGHEFRDNGDTEVLVHLWEEYGEKMVDHLIGMFAFAIYDTKKQILFIARDRFGQKPLFYFQNSEIFGFASELQALKELSTFPTEIDYNSMGQFFRYGYIPAPKTAYKNVFALSPGCSLILKNGTIKLSQYWKPSVTGENENIDLEQLHELIDRAVKLRLRTDVPLGSFLSGGIDSALISASAMRQLSTPIDTFTISTGDSWCDESKEAQITADHLGTNHHTFNVKSNFIEISAKLAKHYGQPFADHSSVMTYYVSRETRKHVKVALSGDGGDELFGGYNSYLNVAKYARFGLFPNCLKSVADKLISPFLRGSHQNITDSLYALNPLPKKGENISTLFHQYWRNRCFNDDFSNVIKSEESDIGYFSKKYNSASSLSPVNRWMEVDQLLYLPSDILTKVDIASMSLSLECRAPFLDHKIAEFANRISPKAKLKNHQTKFLLKELAKREIPKEIINLPKKGFSMPLGDWMRGELKDWAYSTIFDDSTSWEPYLNKESIKRIWKDHQNNKFDHSNRLWEIISIGLS